MVKLANRVRLIQSVVDALKPGDGEYIKWDLEIRGFGVRVKPKPNGSKTWVCQYRNKQGQSKRMTLGSLTELTAKEARDMATDHRRDFRKGKDPAAERANNRNAMLVRDLCDEYLKWLSGRRQKPVKPSTLKNEKSRIESHIKPLLGKKQVKSFDAPDAVDVVERFFNDVANGKTAVKRAKGYVGGVARGGLGAAHRTTDSLGSILEYAISKKIITTNPVRQFVRERGTRLKPPFDIEVVKRVGKAMREMEAEGDDSVPFRAIRHLILSGFRRMECLTLQWVKLDKRAHCARLEDTKTGPQVRPLGQAALDHLFSFGPANNPQTAFVFPGEGESGHFVGLPKVWKRVAARAEVVGVTLHGLRHWFASAGAELGYSDIVIGAIIGHAKKGVTGRYATAPDSALVFAADRIAQFLADALDSKKSGNVVKFTGVA